MTNEPIDARSLRRMPKVERERIMEQAADLAADDYKQGGSLDLGSECFSKVDDDDLDGVNKEEPI